MSVALRPLTLADVVARSAVSTVGLIVGFALFTALAAQITIPLPWTPVPVTGQTFAVLLTGATLGHRRGGLSQLLYVTLGATGLPFFHNGEGGWDVVTGATGGYLLGFVIASVVVGFLAERGQDRNLVTAIPAMLAGSVVIYVFGVAWLAHVLDVSGVRAVELGLAPFVIGDIVKLVVAGALFPSVWRVVDA